MPSTFEDSWGSIAKPSKLGTIDDVLRELAVQSGEERTVAMNKYSLEPCRHGEGRDDSGEVANLGGRSYMLPMKASNQMLNMDIKVFDGLN